LNPLRIDCLECVNGLGARYVVPVPKLRRGQDVFVEVLEMDGQILTFGPAVRE